MDDKRDAREEVYYTPTPAKKEFLKKVAAIQCDLKAPKNQYNSFGKYKYRNCEDILEAVKPLVTTLNLVLTLTDEVKSIDAFTGDQHKGEAYVFIQATASITDGANSVSVTAQAGIAAQKGMNLAQVFGTSSSYARKYALNGLFLIDDTRDADATNDHMGGQNSKATPVKVITKTQAAELRKLVDFANANEKKFCDYCKSTSIDTIPSGSFEAAKALLNKKIAAADSEANENE